MRFDTCVPENEWKRPNVAIWREERGGEERREEERRGEERRGEERRGEERRGEERRGRNMHHCSTVEGWGLAVSQSTSVAQMRAPPSCHTPSLTPSSNTHTRTHTSSETSGFHHWWTHNLCACLCVLSSSSMTFLSSRSCSVQTRGRTGATI